ncbi:M14 family metallopeptidase [Priestia megaterium]|uniref:M14 family metallopeptidase n=1 Tax=Priestia megaterium TaxID=1404 RepID=UPI000CA0DDC1|nr:M14 family metallocarboxypeptidase [Priestia megaterium]AUO11234.1 hypothetical protein C0569_07970 [Priestia megaterium]PVE69418.1 hypothetical protein DC428_14670 [Priestia megaterium]PVE90018.1 hypothetical protein DC421_08025 [Priestia megaterium]PVE93787.1 hypothetical protein DC426_02075 [Priestia megaterium]PVF00723.1 hypothetical protein DC433_07110 [Priestia megaterium]
MQIVDIQKPYDYTRTIQDIQTLLTYYPYGSLEWIGCSVLGKPIPHILIGNGERKVHINASFHANEWITTNVLLQFVEDYLAALHYDQALNGQEARALFNQITLSAVPIVNPDGVDLVLKGPAVSEPYASFLSKIGRDFPDFQSWKANIRGVDLNNQFPAYWEIEKKRKEPKAPHYRDFPGYESLSEPEAQAMVKLVERHDFDCVIALHTQGEEFYWGYMNEEPTEAEEIASYFERVSGYKAVKTIDSHAGFKDWFILEKKKLGFTLELGKGINPLPLSQISRVYNPTKAILVAAMEYLSI